MATSGTIQETGAPAGPPRSGRPDRERDRLRRRGRWRRVGPGYAMLAPFVVLFGVFAVIALVRALYLSFTDYTGIAARPAEWVGLDNFTRLLGEDRFRKALFNTLLYVVLAVSLTTGLSLCLALAFKGTGWRDRILRTLFFLPAVTSSIAIFLIWRWIFAADRFGLANTVRDLVFGESAVSWLSEPRMTMPILVLLAVWGGCGYGMVIFVAGLNAIPEEYYEQASIDGANSWHRFWYITVPQVKPVTTYVVVTGMIAAFQVFEVIYVLYPGTTSVGGPSDSGLMIVPYLYYWGFERFQLGYASAVAWVLFLVIFLVTLVQLRVTRTLREM
jgi:multiple sugar transport system permease protein